jgi:photosystem II stability/assembly factor-like uncharacterized protein
MGAQRSDDGGQSWRNVFGGDVQDVIGHHNAAEVLYLGTADGRVYRSRDAGISWDPCAQGGRQPGVRVADLAVAHDDPRRLYAGLDGGGVWISADGGDDWAPYGVELPVAVAALTAVPARPGMLYAIAGGALYRCTGGEERWERIDTARPDASSALAALAGKEPVLLMALPEGKGLGRSADDGATWTSVGSDAAWSGGVTAIAPARYHIDTVFAGSGGGQIALSTDRGRTWEMLKQELPPVRDIAAARLA